MEEESGEMHTDDDKVLVDNNKKRTLKTRAQVQALENFYNEHKYPTESMKIQLAESIGLSDKQVSGWFCHRRSKDKRLINGDNSGPGKKDRLIQDRGSAHRQDSCGSTKQGDDRNFDTREVESGRLTLQDYSAAELTYENGGHCSGNNNNLNEDDDTSSGSSSSLRNMSNPHNKDHFDVATSRYLMPTFPVVDATGGKSRSGPSGYLKLKGQVENMAITMVKRQLGKHYREDGPPLSIEFDLLPPGAFESLMQDPVDETAYAGEAALPVSPDISKIRQHPKVGKGLEYNSSTASLNSKIDRTGFKVPKGADISDNYVHEKFKENTYMSNTKAYHNWRNAHAESPRISVRGESKDEYGMKCGQGNDDVRLSSVSSNSHLPGKSRGEQDLTFQKHNEVRMKSLQGKNIENAFSSMTSKSYEYHNSVNKIRPRQITKDGKPSSEKSITNENQARITWEEFPQQPRPSPIDDYQGMYRVVRSAAEMQASISEEDEGSAETSCSLE